MSRERNQGQQKSFTCRAEGPGLLSTQGVPQHARVGHPAVQPQTGVERRPHVATALELLPNPTLLDPLLVRDWLNACTKEKNRNAEIECRTRTLGGTLWKFFKSLLCFSTLIYFSDDKYPVWLNI
jgi:hypothetical protein